MPHTEAFTALTTLSLFPRLVLVHWLCATFLGPLPVAVVLEISTDSGLEFPPPQLHSPEGRPGASVLDLFV